MQLSPEHGGFTDYFVLCSASNPRQTQAICDEVEERLARTSLRPAHIEGYNQAEWVLLDYVDFVVHVFSEKAREFYDLERLWKSAKRLEPAELKPAAPRKRTAASAPAKAAKVTKATKAAKAAKAKGTKATKAAKAPARRVRKSSKTTNP